MKKIKIHCLDGYYYVEDDYLIYCYYFNNNNIKDSSFCEVSDLTDLTISQYNELVTKLNKYYPNYNFNNNNKLEGIFI